MTNLTIGCFYLAFSFIGIPMLIGAAQRRKESDSSLWYALLCVSNTLWTTCMGLFYLLPYEPAALFIYEIRFVFIGTSSLQIYLLATRAFKHRMFQARALAVLYAFPLMTLLAILTDARLGLFRTFIRITYSQGIRMVETAFGFWFWVHCAFCYVTMFMTIHLMIGQLRKLPRNYRFPVVTMLAGLILTVVATIASILDVIPFSLDPAPIVVQLSLVTFYFALYTPHSIDMLFTSRELIFENSGDAIFVLDQDNRILDFNRQALRLAGLLNIDSLRGMLFANFVKLLVDTFDGRFFEDDSSIVTVNIEGADVHYQMSSSHISNLPGKVIGAYVEIKNITPIMSMVHKLQDTAYYDHLTGLFNRHSFARLLRELNTPQELSLGIIVGDVNELKAFNDTYGHIMGDKLLQAITQALRDSSPIRTSWIRLGGDEFLGFVPRTTQCELVEIIEKVNRLCEDWEDTELMGAGITLSYAIRTDMSQEIMKLVNEADLAMYSAKRDRRNRRKSGAEVGTPKA